MSSSFPSNEDERQMNHRNLSYVRCDNAEMVDGTDPPMPVPDKFKSSNDGSNVRKVGNVGTEIGLPPRLKYLPCQGRPRHSMALTTLQHEHGRKQQRAIENASPRGHT